MTIGRFAITFFNIRDIAKAESCRQSLDPQYQKSSIAVVRGYKLKILLMCGSPKYFRVAVCCCRTETPAKYTARSSFIL